MKKPHTIRRYFIISVIAMMLLLVLFFKPNYYAPTIIDYKPTDFKELIQQYFFYSIEQNLKYANSIEVNNKTIWSGKIDAHSVSPDNKKMLFFTGSDVYLAIEDNGFIKLQIAGAPKFYRNDAIQWSPDSKSFYIIKDEFYDSKFPNQSCSTKGKLMTYDISSNEFREVISNFPACDYFLGSAGKIYFFESTASGDLLLKCWWNNHTYIAQVVDNKTFKLIDFGDVIDHPFYSFRYSYQFVGQKGVHMLRTGPNNDIAHIYLDANESNGPAMSIRAGQSLKGGRTYGVLGGSFLPGDRYLSITLHSGEFVGKLLFDMETRKYKELPPNTIIFRNINTHDNVQFEIDKFGIHAIDNYKIWWF